MSVGETLDHAPEAELVRLRARLERERRARLDAELISERTTRQLYERQQDLALLVAVARAANDSSNVQATLTRAIASVCEYVGWPVGHVYLVDEEGILRPTTIWHLDQPHRFEVFRRVTEMTSLVPGQGLGGRVLSTGEPLWLPDVTVEVNFPRARLAPEITVRAGCGFPILIGAEVVGVLEFLNDAVEPPNARLLDVMSQVGTELGRAIERDRARTAERRLHRELSARARELERSNAELEQFASIASHDLQEPLRKVRTFTERVTATEGDRLSDQGRDYLRRANAAGARMQNLVEDLLTFSRVGTRGGAFVAVDLARVVADVLEDLDATIERAGATVRVGELPPLDADPLQMRQLIQNLVSNALKFRREDGCVEVSIDGERRDDVVEITIRDNGIGFDPRYRDRIFQVFERLHGRGSYEGTGIGLALCRKIVERHGGTIRAEGVVDDGATFVATMPMSQLAVFDDELRLAARNPGDVGDARPAAALDRRAARVDE